MNSHVAFALAHAELLDVIAADNLFGAVLDKG